MNRFVTATLLLFVTAALLLSASPPAAAAECYHNFFCSGCITLPGSSATYHIVSTDWTADQKVAIRAGASTWTASSTGTNRGAAWAFIEGSEVSTWALNNGSLEVAFEPNLWWTDQGYPDDAWGVAPYARSGCDKTLTDVVIRSSHAGGPIVWHNLPPSQGGGTSLSAVVAHELGHMVGLQHVDGYVSLMNETVSLSDVAADFLPLYLPNEDDLVGLREVEGAASTGNNLALSRYYWRTDVDPDRTTESWVFSTSGPWTVCQGDCVSPEPVSVLALNLGTSTVNGVDVLWTLSTDQICGDGDDIEFDTTSYNLGVNTPAAIAPDWCPPPGTAVNEYYVCAIIDPDNEVSETSGLDNKIMSERKLEVLSCP